MVLSNLPVMTQPRVCWCLWMVLPFQAQPGISSLTGLLTEMADLKFRQPVSQLQILRPYQAIPIFCNRSTPRVTSSYTLETLTPMSMTLFWWLLSKRDTPQCYKLRSLLTLWADTQRDMALLSLGHRKMPPKLWLRCRESTCCRNQWSWTMLLRGKTSSLRVVSPEDMAITHTITRIITKITSSWWTIPWWALLRTRWTTMEEEAWCLPSSQWWVLQWETTMVDTTTTTLPLTSTTWCLSNRDTIPQCSLGNSLLNLPICNNLLFSNSPYIRVGKSHWIKSQIQSWLIAQR